MQIAILGAGMVGRTIAIDLSQNHDVTSFDINSRSLELLQQKTDLVATMQADLMKYDQYASWLSPFDLVVSAVPGFMGYKALEAIIGAGKNVVDISFFPENALELDSLAKKHHVTAIVDCGVAPGLSNLILGHCDAAMTVESFTCLVGGLPKKRTWPFEYKAPFSPIDVLEEYTRPARLVENGQVITRPALSEPELHDFEQAGTLESFNTDGLRSILHTMKHIPTMKEKTLRYPGHIQFITAMMRSGFFDKEERNINGKKISPFDVTADLLFHQWKLEEDDDEFTIMKINVTGMSDNRPASMEYFLYDEKDKNSLTSSMSRTTGYTCAAAVQLLSKNMFRDPGVFPPELIGRHKDCFEEILQYLSERNIHVQRTIHI